MSKYLEHNERIASYLDGLMNPNQMQEFEKQLHTDPILRSEFELQQDIIHSLQDFRKSQLKTRLDQVPVSVGPTVLVGIKAAAALVISGIIGLGAYLYFADPSNETDAVSEAIVSNEIQASENVITDAPQISSVESTEESVVTETETIESETETPITEVTEAPAATKQPELKVEKVSPEENKKEEIEKSGPVINTPDLINPDLDETDVEETIELPNSAIAQEGLADNNVVEVETAKKDSDMFHYQYYSGKLYLYGDFRDYPYEILELNSISGKRLFIYYNNTYYRIMDNQEEITPLEKLTDQDIIKKLEIIQANK